MTYGEPGFTTGVLFPLIFIRNRVFVLRSRRISHGCSRGRVSRRSGGIKKIRWCVSQRSRRNKIGWFVKLVSRRWIGAVVVIMLGVIL
ncbi:hypothetical protein TSUD_12200 [Trifolium subterraneum]|uniref:Uncharacterized protein n=1 Tax=Trifolium subterraneum TaxID=3900 RepID=A0A2Z6LPH6_TRISU|nr:hypothetical protein TSUD_12200 [Trifolium subterraneum]